MDPFTFGIIATGAFGSTLALIGLLDDHGVKINSKALTIAMECVKHGGILSLLQQLSTLFF